MSFNDWQSLKKKWNFSAIAAYVSYVATENLDKLICRVIHWAQSLHGDCKEQVCRGQLRVLLTFPGGSHVHHLSNRSAAASVRGAEIQAQTKCYHYTSSSSSNLSLHDATGSTNNQSPLWGADAARNWTFWVTSGYYYYYISDLYVQIISVLASGEAAGRSAGCAIWYCYV